MGYFDACIQPFRSDALGRRVIVPFRWFGPVYLVPDNEAVRIRRGLKRLQMGTVAAIIIASATGPLSFKLIPLIMGGQTLWLYLLTHNLSRAGVRRQDLPRVARREAIARYYAAMGKSTLWVTHVLALAMNALFIWGAVEFGGVLGWTVTVLFTIINGVMIFDLIQYRSYYTSPASPHPI